MQHNRSDISIRTTNYIQTNAIQVKHIHTVDKFTFQTNVTEFDESRHEALLIVCNE